MRSPSIAPPRSLLFRAHAALWAVAGSTAALYLGWTLLGPGPDETVALKTDRRQTAIDGRNLENALLQLSGDVRAVQGKLAEGDEQTHVILGRLTTLEEKTSMLATSAQSSASPGATRPAAPAQSTSSITTGTILQQAAAPAGTGTQIAQGVPPAAVAALTSPKAVLAVQLASAANLDALRLNWSLLSERHRALLGAMQTRYRQAAGRPNAPYQLIAGPVRSPQDAARICKELAASGVTCRATSFSGETL